MAATRYDDRYLQGVEYFNSRQYFASHEVWEDLWLDSQGPDKGYFKGLIQAAVSLHHLAQGNKHGAGRLLAGCTRYLTPYCPVHLGLDVSAFLAAMSRCVGQAATGVKRSGEGQPGAGPWPKICLGQRLDIPTESPRRPETHEQL